MISSTSGSWIWMSQVPLMSSRPKRCRLHPGLGTHDPEEPGPLAGVGQTCATRSARARSRRTRPLVVAEFDTDHLGRVAVAR